jgi:two-component system phosphate regulon sensor histidine kinase PhoR
MLMRNGEFHRGLFTAVRDIAANIVAWAKNRKRPIAPRWIGVLAAALVLFTLIVVGKISAVTGLTSILFIIGVSLVLSRLIESLPDEFGRLAEKRSMHTWTGSRSTDRSTWRAVVDAIPTAALALDENAVVIHQNALVAELFPKVRTGYPFSSVMRYPELMAAVDDGLTDGGPVVVEFIERVPMERRISATISKLEPTQTASPAPALLITFRDLTEHDRLTQMRADFIAYASHELRTPLASLRGFVETLQGPARDDPDARDRFLGLMASQASRMTRLIDDLLSLSRVEMRAHIPPRGIVELGEVAAYVAQTLEPLAQANRTVVKVHRPDVAARIRGDRDEIVQVLQNLVHNAIKYGREGGKVDVHVSRVAVGPSGRPRLTVAISDEGSGIPAEHLPRLTERFYRVNKSQSREKGGTGLGLAIVKHIVVRHQGELSISSKPGEGSTFAISFDELGFEGASERSHGRRQ